MSYDKLRGYVKTFLTPEELKDFDVALANFDKERSADPASGSAAPQRAQDQTLRAFIDAVKAIERDTICTIDMDCLAESEVVVLKDFLRVLQDYARGYDEDDPEQPRFSTVLDQLAAAQGVITRLRGYVQHKDDCRQWDYNTSNSWPLFDKKRPCSCGLADFLANLHP